MSYSTEFARTLKSPTTIIDNEPVTIVEQYNHDNSGLYRELTSYLYSDQTLDNYRYSLKSNLQRFDVRSYTNYICGVVGLNINDENNTIPHKPMKPDSIINYLEASQTKLVIDYDNMFKYKYFRSSPELNAAAIHSVSMFLSDVAFHISLRISLEYLYGDCDEQDIRTLKSHIASKINKYKQFIFPNKENICGIYTPWLLSAARAKNFLADYLLVNE